MGPLTIYVTSADLTTLNAILNGVAMICGQTNFIWGVAMLASMWIIFSTVVRAPINAVSGKAEGILPTGHLNSVMPFIMALMLTTPGFQGTVQVESSSSGSVTVIDHVPYIIAVIPAVGSILSQEAGGYVETAFQSTGTDYASISASGNGFINPLKVLLASRSAINRLNGIPAQINSVVTNCLGPDAGVDYSYINHMVTNSGNTGATAAASIPINGANPTILGALLYRASLNDGGHVSSIGTGDTILNCADAAQVVAQNTTDAINSVEFKRVVQGAVNGMDQPNIAGNTDIATMNNQWSAVRNANTVTAAITVGSNQAQSEVINLLMGEIVKNQLTCMNKAAEGRTTCEAALVQANEIERHNIQLAAAEIPMLQYAGSFGNYLLALIIGLGPIVVIFMMFSGVNAGKSIKTVAHLIAWPLLVMNVGAELINGMMYIQIANFAQGLASGGYLSLAQNVAVYKELSFQIGSASHMMASLPVIMGMIFALGESAALVSVGSNVGPKGSGVVDSATPTVNKQDAIFSQSGFGNSKQLAGSGAITELNGAMPMISASSKGGEIVSKMNEGIHFADATIQSSTQNEQVATENARVASTQDYKEWGFTDSEAQAYRKHRSDMKRDSATDQSGTNNSTTSDTETNTQATAGFSAGFGPGGVGPSVGGSTMTQAADGDHHNTNSGHQTEANKARETGSVVEDALNFAKTHGFGERAVNELTNRNTAQQSYLKSLTSNQTASDTIDKVNEQGSSMIAYAASIDEGKLISAFDRGETGIYMNMEREKQKGNASIQRNLGVARKDADGSATFNVAGNEKGRESLLLFKAAQLTAQDPNASPEEKYEANKLVAGALSHMMHGGVEAKQISEPKTIKGQPVNITGQALPSNTQTLGAVPPATRSTAIPAPNQSSAPRAQAPANSSTPALRSPPKVKPPAALTTAISNFDNNFGKPLEAGFNPTEAVQQGNEQAKDKGLTGGKGTARRVVRKVADNAGLTGGGTPDTDVNPN